MYEKKGRFSGSTMSGGRRMLDPLNAGRLQSELLNVGNFCSNKHSEFLGFLQIGAASDRETELSLFQK